MEEHEQVIIIGSGPAGYTAALYAARADLSPLVIEGFLWGGLLQQTTDVENYPGFTEGIMGPRADADDARPGRALRRALPHRQRDARRARGGGGRPAHGVGRRRVIPGPHRDPRDGRRAQEAGCSGEDELANGRGVSYCATCDAAFFKDRETIVVGGGDSAMEEAIFLAKFSSKVTIVHRRDEFRASQIMVDRAKATENIEFLTPYVVDEFLPGEGGALGSARVRQLETGEQREIPMSGAFVAIGHEPQSGIVDGIVETDDDGYVAVEGRSTRTQVPGMFAAGDLVDHTYRQAVTAAGSGCQAALDAEWYLRDNPLVPTPPVLEGTGDLAEGQWFHHEPAARQ